MKKTQTHIPQTKRLTIMVCLLFMAVLALMASRANAQTQTFNTTGTFVVPAGVTSVNVQVWGGGGSGGGNTTTNDGAGGGGGGAYSATNGIAVTPGASLTVTVGDGANGGTGNGSAGGDSWFINSTTILAKGGNGGFAPVSGAGGVFGTGGLGSSGIGTTKFSGGTGGTGRDNSSGSGGPGGSSAGTGAIGTSGAAVWSTTNAGAAPTGGGQGGDGGGSSNNGEDANTPGGGGGGAGDKSSSFSSNRNGGDGADGRVVVSWTCATYSLTNTTVTSFCGAGASTVTLSGNAANLPVGTYTVTYNQSAPNSATGVTKTMTVAVAGSGSFNTNTLTNLGNTTITITNISSGAAGGTCSNSSLSNNTAVISVGQAPTVSPTSSANTICNGTSTVLNANSALSFSNTTAVAIPDNNATGVNTTITLPSLSIANAAGMEVSLTFNPEHTWASDVIVKLTNPAAQTTTLFDRLGISPGTDNSDDLNGTYVFATSGATVMPEADGTQSTGGNINQGTYLPSATNGTAHNWSGFTFPVATAGTWTLNLSDRVGSDVGTLASWSIKVYTTSGMTYTWTSTPSGFNASTSSVSVSPSAAITYNVFATYTGCNSATGNKSISVNPSPVPIANSNEPVCEGLTINFSGDNAASGQTTGNSYQWSGPSSFSSSQQNPAISGASSALHAGTYTVTVTNQFLCTATLTEVVGINLNPAIALASQTNVTCNGFNDGTINVTSTGGGTDHLFTDGNSFNLDGIFTGEMPGIYTVNVSDINGCSSEMPVTITEPDVLSFTESHVDVLCNGNTNGSITLTAAGGNTPYQYSINNGTNFQPGNGFTGLADGIFTALIADANNCPVSSQTVAINYTYINSTAPTAITTDDLDNQICTPNSVMLTQNGGSLGNAPGTIYKWHSGSCNGPLVGSGTATSLSINPSTTTTFYVNTDGLCGASNCAPVTIIASSVAPSASVVVPPIVGLPTYACNGTNAVISVPAVSGATQYIWDAPTGTSFSSSSNIYTSNTSSVDMVFGNPNSSGYLVGVQAANACGATLRKAQWVRGIVSVPPAVIPANATLTHCANTTANFSCALMLGATDYGWSVTGDATITNTANNATVVFGPAWNGGTICVSAKTPCYTSPAKCINLSKSAAPTTQILGVFTTCPGSTQNYNVAPVSGAASYTWILPNNTTGSSTSNNINITFNNGFSQGDICVQATSICGVTSAPKCKTVTSGVPTRPASVSGFSNGVCGQSVVYNTPPISGGTFNWTLPAGSIGSSTNNSITATMPNNLGNDQVCVSVTNACGTSSNRCISVKGSPNSPANINVNLPTICPGEAGVQFSADVNNISGSYNLNWTFPATTTYVTGQSTPNLTLDWGSVIGTVILTASNSCGSGSKAFMVDFNGCRIANTQTAVESLIEKLNVYPNPARDFINIDFSSEKSEVSAIQITDLQGRAIYFKSVDAQNFLNEKINTETFAKGIYLLKIVLKDGNAQARFVLE